MTDQAAAPPSEEWVRGEESYRGEETFGGTWVRYSGPNIFWIPLSLERAIGARAVARFIEEGGVSR